MMSNNQTEYINKVKGIAVNPVYCSNNYFNDKIKNYQPGKRYSLNKYNIKDYLTVASNQIVFELDAKSYAANYELALKIISVLDTFNYPYYIYASGGKGIHIELFFDKPIFNNKEIKELFKEAISFNLSFKHLRFWLWNFILDEAGISEDLRGNGKIIDSSCINFDDLKDKTKLLRVPGGRKIYYNKVTGSTEIYYKTFIDPEEFNKTNVKIKNFESVKYPNELKCIQLNLSELGQFLIDYINNAKACNNTQQVKVNLKHVGGYLNLDSVKRIREGLQCGQRNLGAQILAIAMANDSINEKEQFEIMEEYVKNCSQIGSEFELEEAKMWIKWVNSQEEIFWNCGLIEVAGLHDSTMCEFCKAQHKESLALLKSPSLLSYIKEYLDIEIVGEDDIKMLIFLLTLSKDFPSRTGRPDWNIPNDPMSQNIILASDSSSGKTYIAKKILELFGKEGEDYYIISRMSKSVINYYTEENMDGKIIFIEEMQGLDENTSQLRVWMSEGKLTFDSVEKVKDEDGIERNARVRKTTIGQPCFLTCQAEGTIGEQLNNRTWLISLDISSSQTQKILDYQDAGELSMTKSSDKLKRLIIDALKQLKPYHFKIPFADNTALKIPTKDIRARRDYQKFLTLVKSITYFHQKQRPIIRDKDKEYLICSLEDYEIAKMYSSGILGSTFSGLTNSQIDLINHLKQSEWLSEFNISTLIKDLGKSQSYWYGQLRQLEELGYILAEKSLGRSTTYSLNIDKVVNLISLPPAKELENIYSKNYNALTKDAEVIQ